jgi:hypothetical protein
VYNERIRVNYERHGESIILPERERILTRISFLLGPSTSSLLLRAEAVT